jgi:hypothetical protein
MEDKKPLDQDPLDIPKLLFALAFGQENLGPLKLGLRALDSVIQARWISEYLMAPAKPEANLCASIRIEQLMTEAKQVTAMLPNPVPEIYRLASINISPART